MFKVNETPIAEAAVLQEMQYHPSENAEQAKARAVESLIISELLKQRALQVGLEIDSQENFVDNLISREVSFPVASQQDCENYYTNNTNKFCTSPLLEVKHILLACDPNDASGRSQANDLADQLIVQLRETPALFEDLAKQHSHCPSAETGGSLGQISSGQTVPEFERQLFHCGEGLVDSPIESRYGIHVVFINHREEAKQLPYPVVAERIADYLNNKVRNVAIAQYIATLIDNATIEGYQFKQLPEQYHH
ncbi:peptidyl-prolyl cis-trans isomerase C [Alteromonadaceae bacterium 2753L.S.0a.02]|nr:peptidyl-prolyl cis-trans isomerase C [Alteromonadaceae bacterium 2753L.S.0a.02]